MKLTKLSAAWLPEWACRLMPAMAWMDAGTASQLIPGVRRTWKVVRMTAGTTLRSVAVAICVPSASAGGADECQPTLQPSAEACALAPSGTLRRILGAPASASEGCRHPESRAATCSVAVADGRLEYQVLPAFPRLKGLEPEALRGWLERAAARDGTGVDFWTWGRMLCWNRVSRPGHPVTIGAPIGCTVVGREVAVTLRVFPGRQQSISVHQVRQLLELACVNVLGSEAP